MANDLPRLMLFDHEDTFIRDLDPDSVWRAYTIYEVNGEHSLTIETTDELAEGDRIVWRDGMLLWHEHVVTGQVSERNVGGVVVHSYWCAWSLQYDLANTFVSAMPGTVTSVGPRAALEAALGGTQRWTVGTVSQGGTNGTSMFRMSGWEAMQELVETWGGEVSATITVGAAGVTSRQVNLLSHEGNETPTRRFDYAGDLSGIKRTLPEQPWAARVIPLGKAQQTEGGGYGRRTTIESVNGGVMWLQNAAVVPFVRVPDGQGGWEVPVRKVETDAYDDPAALKAWAQDHLEEWTTPQASYEADVVQLTRAGLDAQGVALGDEIVVVDHTFGPSGIAIQGRALRIEEDLRDPAQTRITVSALRDTLGDQLGGLARQVNTLSRNSADTGEYQATAAYLSELLASINEVANALGGYAYYTEGQGIRTYDRPVSDPLVGAEATKVVEIKGGTIRIADSRTSGGDWDWRTVFVAGHIAAELVTASNIVAGFIQSADGYSYWDLDANTLKLLGRNASVEVGNVDTSTGAMKSGTTITADELSYKSQYGVVFRVYSSNPSNYISDGILRVQSSDGTGFIQLKADHMTRHECEMWVANRFSAVSAENRFKFGGDGDTSTGKFSAHANYIELESVTCKVYGAFSVSGTKSRIVDTDDYGTRRLYAYETPSPMFGDLGSASTDESGECYVMLDDVFAQTARTDLPYQVFIQKCGEGDLWVAEKKPTHFVVRGTPNLAFDWELKAKQRDYESERLEDDFIATPDAPMDGMPSDMTYSNEMDEIVCGIADQYEQEITELEVMVR